jgi:hypothetical protein
MVAVARRFAEINPVNIGGRMSLIPSARDEGFNEALSIPSPAPKQRAHYLPADSLFGLHHACGEIMRAYPDSFGVYLVGSCLERKNYRDVDVRCIMADDDFEREFPKNDDNLRPRFMLLCLSLSAWLRHVTGLPVDFQFQKQSIANEKHKGSRNALGFYAWTGDAT